jgi:hypothetical protein
LAGILKDQLVLLRLRVGIRLIALDYVGIDLARLVEQTSPRYSFIGVDSNRTDIDEALQPPLLDGSIEQISGGDDRIQETPGI